jgi:serine/threonine protein kinase
LQPFSLMGTHERLAYACIRRSLALTVVGLQIVKLVDFGMILDLSKEPHSRGMMGSPGFVAPEVILGQHHTSQMDCYSLGVLLFVMLVGAKPMTQDQARSMQYALMTPESLRGMHVRSRLPKPNSRALQRSTSFGAVLAMLVACVYPGGLCSLACPVDATS